ncbi:MAG: hypothetical protein OXU81_19875 [Gammaproteobacteria bacterium]|nr:hypothetical protein [Gammaproteobacteria bacterium]
MTRAIEVLPGYRPVAAGEPGEEATIAYERDGVVCLRGAFEHLERDSAQGKSREG